MQVPIGKPIKIEGGATEAAMATLTAFGLPAGNEVNVRLLRFGKSAVLQKIFVMLYPYASDPRLLYMLAYCEEDPNCKPVRRNASLGNFFARFELSCLKLGVPHRT